jgi:dipeptidyl aminopeptidase/acylaminoacyl peptidase
MVALARRPGGEMPGFLAARVPPALYPETVSPLAGQVEEIGAPGLSISSDPSTWPGDPQVRPTRGRLDIRAYAALPPAPAVESPRPGPEVRQTLALRRIHPEGASLAVYDPSSGLRELVGEDRNPNCPALSPDGSQIAFLTLASVPAGGNLVALVSTGGGEFLQLTSASSAYGLPSTEYGSPPFFGCPTWSPDGKRLALEVSAGGADYLGIISAEKSEPDTFLLLGRRLAAPPFWVPKEEGAEQILLVYPGSIYKPLLVVAMDPSSVESLADTRSVADVGVQLIAEVPGTGQVAAFTASPDGKQFALVRVRYNSAFNLVTGAELIVFDGAELATIDLGEYDPDRAGARSLAWLADGRVGVLHPLPLNGSIMALVEIYNPREASPTARLSAIAALGDAINAAVWTPDASWVFLAGESGLYALDVKQAQAGTVAPARLLADWIVEMD